MTEYQPNSHRSKELQKAEAAKPAVERKVQRVVTSGKAKTRTNNGRKLADIFISEDAANIKSYIFMDVLVPAIKKAISDIVTDGVSMLLYGGKGSSRSSDRVSAAPKVSYRSYYDDGRDRRDGYSAKVRFDYADISFPSRGDAEAALDQMINILDHYPFVTVADLYEMAGLERECPHTANKYGWTNLRSADVMRVSDGYVLKLPKAMPID